MPLTKLQFRPGIIREITEYSNSGGWFDCDKIRFRQGYPEKIGGWLSVVRDQIQGTCRHIHQWSSLENDRYVGLGTSSHLYILWSENYYDITPLRINPAQPAAPLAANPFTTGSPIGSTSMTVAIPSHGAHIGDWVNFTGATAFDVYTAAQLNAQYQVVAVPDGNTITITMPVANATANLVGGGAAVTATFLIPSGLDDAVIGMGWGIPPWNACPTVQSPPTGSVPSPNPPTCIPSNWQAGWGVAWDPRQLDPVDPTVNQLRLWDLDNFGEDLVANIRGGPIYYWHQAGGLSQPAVPLNQAVTVGGVTFTPDFAVPATARQVLVSPNDRHLIAMGCEDINSAGTGINAEADLLLIRWSTEENAYTWNPLRTNTAGGQRLSAGSYIIGAMRTASEILIWTDLGLWSQKYIGAPYVFGFEPIAEGLSIIGPNACINTGSIVTWMDRGIFYAYTGQCQELPCALKDYIFNDFNYLQGYKVYAGHNHAFSEVIWFYPSASSLENDRYVIYNYGEQLWSLGTIERTAWLDMGRASYPVASDRKNQRLYYHEYGDDDDGSPMPAWVESADIDIDGGDHYLFLSRLIPDVAFRGTAPQQSLGITILTRPAPGRSKTAVAELEVTPYTPEQYIRVRERQISFRVESEALGVSWRLGTLRTDMQPDGKR
jgi:hypothetical protein